MLSISHSFLFIHLPKTAGNSLQERLKEYSEDQVVCVNNRQDGVERFEIRNKDFPTLHKHSTLEDYWSALPSEICHSLTVIATIRNPWDRMISYYFSPHRGAQRWDRKDFYDLVLDAATLPNMLRIAGDTDDQAISRAAVLLRYEHLALDFENLCTFLAIDHQPLSTRNASVRRHYRDYYDDELVALVRDKFSAEIDCGGYTF